MLAMLKIQHEIIQRQNIEWSRTQQVAQSEQLLAALRNQTMANAWNTIAMPSVAVRGPHSLSLPSAPVVNNIQVAPVNNMAPMNNLALQAAPVNRVSPMVVNGNLNISRVPPPPGLERQINRPAAQNNSSSTLNSEPFDLSSIWSADWTPNNRQ